MCPPPVDDLLDDLENSVNTMTDDIKITIDDVITVKNDLVRKLVGDDYSKLEVVRELLIAIYIRGFFAGAHMAHLDDQVLVMEMVKAKLS